MAHSWHELTTTGRSQQPSDHRRWWLAILLLAAVLRLVGLNFWPEVQADEGLWSIGPKNFVLHGDWFLDGRTHLFLSPLFHSLSALIFEVSGPGITAARVLSALSGVGTVALLAILVQRVSRSRELALLSATLMCVNQFHVLLSRTALIESLETFFLTATALAFVAASNKPRFLLAALMFALALLTKLNAAFFAAAAGIALLYSTSSTAAVRQERLRSLVALVVGGCFAGLVYGLLYSWRPDQFIAAFMFELDGIHFESASDPLLRLGRFAVEPEAAAESVLALFREMPFLMVLGLIGLAARALDRFRGDELLAAWLIVGVGFNLVQMYQPIRYFFLVLPPLGYFAATGLLSLRDPAGLQAKDSGRPLPVGLHLKHVVVGGYVLFQLGYVVAGAMTNPSTKLKPVVARFQAIARSDTVVAAPYVCVDLRQVCLSHYRLVRQENQGIREAVSATGADWVVVDDGEWTMDQQRTIDQTFQVVETWPFVKLYRIPQPMREDLGDAPGLDPDEFAEFADLGISPAG